MLQHQPARVLERMSICMGIGFQLPLPTDMNVAKEHSTAMEKHSTKEFNKMSAVAEASMHLRAMAGDSRAEGRWWHLRCLLGWHAQGAETRIRHLYYAEQRPTPEQLADIRRARAKHILDAHKARHDQRRQDAELLARLVALAEESDFEFYRPHLEALREAIDGQCGGAHSARNEDQTVG